MTPEKAIVFFDGYCHLCNGAVRFIIKRDSRNYFKFAPLQGQRAYTDLPESFKTNKQPDSLILLENGQIYIESTAALKIAAKLRFPWNLINAFIIIPTCMRDPVYRFVAKRRYAWFGKSDHCAMPAQGWKERFLP